MSRRYHDIRVLMHRAFAVFLTLSRAVGDRDGEANTLWHLADLKRKQDDLQTSLKNIQSAIAIIEDLRGTYTNQDLKTSYFSTVQGYYKFYIDLLMEQSAVKV